MSNKLDLIAVGANIEFEWVETSGVGFSAFMINLEINLSLTEGSHICDHLENDEMRYYRHLIEFQSLENHRDESYHTLNAWFPYAVDPMHKETIDALLGSHVNSLLASTIKERESMDEHRGVVLFGAYTPRTAEQVNLANRPDNVHRIHWGGLLGIGADKAQPILDRLAREI